MEKTIEKVNTLLTHYSLPTLLGQHFKHALEALQFDLGVDTPFLNLPYRTFGKHLTHGWFRDLWESVSLYPVTFEFQNYPTLPLQRVNDKYIMREIIHLGQFHSFELAHINNVRHHFRCYSYSDIYDISGTSVRPRFLSSTAPPPSSTITNWSRTQPSLLAFSLWRQALRLLQPSPLGSWLQTTHYSPECYYHPATSIVYLPHHRRWATYSPVNHRPRRHGSIYRLRSYTFILPPYCHRGLFTRLSSNRIQFEGSAAIQLPWTSTSCTFKDYLLHQGEHWLWEYLNLPEELDWLAPSLQSNSVLLVCDGSYQPSLSPIVAQLRGFLKPKTKCIGSPA